MGNIDARIIGVRWRGSPRTSGPGYSILRDIKEAVDGARQLEGTDHAIKPLHGYPSLPNEMMTHLDGEVGIGT